MPCVARLDPIDNGGHMRVATVRGEALSSSSRLIMASRSSKEDTLQLCRRGQSANNNLVYSANLSACPVNLIPACGS